MPGVGVKKRVKSYEPTGPLLPERLGVLLLLLDGMLVHRRYSSAFYQVFLSVCWYPFILLGEEKLTVWENKFIL